jgi:hypothetical protein
MLGEVLGEVLGGAVGEVLGAAVGAALPTIGGMTTSITLPVVAQTKVASTNKRFRFIIVKEIWMDECFTIVLIFVVCVL